MTRPWREVAHLPGAPEALRARQHDLDRAFRTGLGTRADIIRDAARDRRVLDVGCVGHSAEGTSSPTWLHSLVTAVADSCVGIDNNVDGVAALVAAGHDVRVCDVLAEPPSDLRSEPFDVVVAGEVIEHLDAPIALLRFAAKVLRPGGRLILTTPNPFAPWRARAGQLRIAWENADHLVYLFPSGMVEMAARTGFRLDSISTENDLTSSTSMSASLRTLAKGLARRALGRPGDQPARGRFGIPLPRTWLSPIDYAVFRTRSPLGQSRERSIYQLTLIE